MTVKRMGTGTDILAMAAKIVADNEGKVVALSAKEVVETIAILATAAEVCRQLADQLRAEAKEQFGTLPDSEVVLINRKPTDRKEIN